MNMPITIQTMDETTAKWIHEEANRLGVAPEAVVIRLIYKGIEADKKETKLRTFDDLDDLAGTWSEEETAEFLETTKDFGQTDENLWK